MSKKRRIPKANNAPTLDDFSGSLEKLAEEVQKLIELHGPNTIITFDAGYNNVSALLTTIIEVDNDS